MSSYQDLRRRAYRVPLYWILMRATEKHDLTSAEGKELLREHLQWQFDLEERGMLLGAGPLDVGYERAVTDRPILDAWGVSIVAAPSREAAERIASTEPFRVAGWRENIVASWALNEGSAAELARRLVEGVGGHPPAPMPGRPLMS
jgi:uncharacterized protein YciI